MIRKTHVTLEETVGEFTVSLHLPVGVSFNDSLQMVAGFYKAIEGFAQEALDLQAKAEQEKPDVAQPEAATDVAGA